jgi:hypothetical protein
MRNYVKQFSGANPELGKQFVSTPQVNDRRATIAAALLVLLSACSDTPSTSFITDTDSPDATDTYLDTDDTQDTTSPDGSSESVDSETELDIPECGSELRRNFLAAMQSAENYANLTYQVQAGERNRFFAFPGQEAVLGTRLDDSIHTAVNSQGNQTVTTKTTFERIANSGQRSLTQGYYQTGDGLLRSPVVVRANFSGAPDNSLTGNLVAFQVTTNAIQGDSQAANHQFRVEYFDGTAQLFEVKYSDGTQQVVCPEDGRQNLSGVTGSALDQQADHPDSRIFQ